MNVRENGSAPGAGHSCKLTHRSVQIHKMGGREAAHDEVKAIGVEWQGAKIADQERRRTGGSVPATLPTLWASGAARLSVPAKMAAFSTPGISRDAWAWVSPMLPAPKIATCMPAW